VRDVRHRFAIQTLLDWYREGADVERQLPTLSTYLGHTCVRDTYAALRSALRSQAMKPSGNVATIIERYFTERLNRRRSPDWR
jgi:hypothetical protein